MTEILSTVMQHLNWGYFHPMDNRRRVMADIGEITIEDGIIKPLKQRYQVGQYIRILGSVFNNGVFQIERIGGGFIDVNINDSDYPRWILPSGTVGLYRIGDRVTHNGIRYVSLVNNNSWAPGTDERLWEKVGMVEHSLRNEIFSGAVCLLVVPREFLELCRSIENYVKVAETDPKQALLLAESFSGYSYTKATGADGMTPRWQEVFRIPLRPYNRMFQPDIL